MRHARRAVSSCMPAHAHPRIHARAFVRNSTTFSPASTAGPIPDSLFRPTWPTVRAGHLHLGLIDYLQAWEIQKRLRVGPPPDAPPHTLSNVVLTLEHPPVYTMGYGASPADLRFDPAGMNLPAPVHRVERGGKITFHGPGQLVVYPLLDLRDFKQDLHWYVRSIEEALIRTLADFGLSASRSSGYPGVWVADAKIAQVGMICAKWRTAHGFALNINNDLEFFKRIVPCGIQDRDVCSMASLLGHQLDVESVQARVLAHFADILNIEWVGAQVDSSGVCTTCKLEGDTA